MNQEDMIMAKTLIAFFSRADENYFGGAMRYVKVGNTEIVCGLINEMIEAGHRFVIATGRPVYSASVVANIGLACVLLIVGYLLYKENISIRQIVGILACMFGLILINI